MTSFQSRFYLKKKKSLAPSNSNFLPLPKKVRLIQSKKKNSTLLVSKETPTNAKVTLAAERIVEGLGE